MRRWDEGGKKREDFQSGVNGVGKFDGKDGKRRFQDEKEAKWNWRKRLEGWNGQMSFLWEGRGR